MTFLPPAQAFRFNLEGDASTVLGGAGVLTGWSLTEGSGTDAAQVEIFDGAQNTDHLLAVVTLSAGQSTRDLWAPSGIELRNGLLVAVTVGTAYGALFAVPGEVVDAFMVAQGYRPIWSGNE